jgi:hypothetical protein
MSAFFIPWCLWIHYSHIFWGNSLYWRLSVAWHEAEMTEEFVQEEKEAEPIAMITEGTNMTGAEISSEQDVCGNWSIG